MSWAFFPSTNEQEVTKPLIDMSSRLGMKVVQKERNVFIGPGGVLQRIWFDQKPNPIHRKQSGNWKRE